MSSSLLTYTSARMSPRGGPFTTSAAATRSGSSTTASASCCSVPTSTSSAPRPRSTGPPRWWAVCGAHWGEPPEPAASDRSGRVPLDLGQPPAKEVALGLVAGQREGLPIAPCGLCPASRPPEQIGARRVQQVMARELPPALERVDEAQAGLWAFRHRDRGGPIQLDHRRGLHAHELPVERRDRRPVGVLGARGARVEGGDRRLQGVRPRTARRARPLVQRETLTHLRPIPAAPILRLEEHDLAVAGGAGLAPRIVEEHEGEERAELRRIGQEPAEQAGEPDRLGAQLAPDERLAEGRRVALVEHQVGDHHHRLEPLREDVPGGHLVGDARLPDLALRAHEALRHGGCGDEEGARDLLRREPAEGAQRERNLRLEREGRVAAGEDQTQPIVRHRALPLVLARRVERREPLQLLELLRKAALAPQAVDGLVASRLGHPRTRVRGRALARPLLERRRKRLVHDLLGEVEVAEQADQGGEDAPRLLAIEPADHLRDHRPSAAAYTTADGRTARLPAVRATDGRRFAPGTTRGGQTFSTRGPAGPRSSPSAPRECAPRSRSPRRGPSPPRGSSRRAALASRRTARP